MLIAKDGPHRCYFLRRNPITPHYQIILIPLIKPIILKMFDIKQVVEFKIYFKCRGIEYINYKYMTIESILSADLHTIKTYSDLFFRYYKNKLIPNSPKYNFNTTQHVKVYVEYSLP